VDFDAGQMKIVKSIMYLLDFTRHCRMSADFENVCALSGFVHPWSVMY